MSDITSKKSLVVSLDKKLDMDHEVFLIAGLGGHVISLQLLAREIADGVKSYGLLHPVFLGYDSETVEEVAQLMFDDIVASQSKPPYFVAGFSMGGLIAIEVARLMQKQNFLAHVILVDTYVPVLPPKKPLLLRIPIHLRWHAERIITRLTKGGYSDHKKKLVAINEGCAMKPKMPPRFQKAFDIGRQSIKNYTLTPCDINVVLIRSEHTPWWDNLRYWPEDRGWGEYVNLKGHLSCPGDHLDLLTNPKCRVKTGQAIVSALGILNAPT